MTASKPLELEKLELRITVPLWLYREVISAMKIRASYHRICNRSSLAETMDSYADKLQTKLEKRYASNRKKRPSRKAKARAK